MVRAPSLGGGPMMPASTKRAPAVSTSAPMRRAVSGAPAWSKGPFGAVDVERDYAALFKPALLATAPGGTVIATNHVASVVLEDWIAALRRAAEKAGRPLADIETLAPDEDFPTRDGRAPLKIAVCRARD
jgi:23S rRNA (cytosine1962-C5)-methyltransferase